ncbi:hypothetical protein P886_4570 [Alteromonadaceae bacterium 2753L.S.0a.02]|nr:hypothetical protein P886_4570 [Alteromonadaceae bacterium 2753L.S.0a.02]
MDSISAALLMFGIVLLLASWIEMLVVSFKNDYSWGLTTLFVPPISYIYGLWTWEKARASLMMAALGWVLILLSL